MRLERWRAAKRWWRGLTTPTLSLCVVTAGEPERVRRLLEPWRPHVDEIFLALDERGPHEAIVRATGGLVDRTAILPPMVGSRMHPAAREPDVRQLALGEQEGSDSHSARLGSSSSSTRRIQSPVHCACAQPR